MNRSTNQQNHSLKGKTMRERVLSNIKTDLYSDYAYNLFSMWKLLFVLKHGVNATPLNYSFIKAIETFNLNREPSGEVILQLLDKKSYGDISYFKQYDSFKNSDSVFKRIGNFMKYIIEDNSFSLNIVFQYEQPDKFYLISFDNLEKLIVEDAFSINHLFYNEKYDNELFFQTIDINPNNATITEHNKSRNNSCISTYDRELVISFYKKIFDLLQIEKEGEIYKVSVLDVLFLNLIRYINKNEKKTFESLEASIKNNEFFKNALETIISVRNLTCGDYRNFCMFLLNRKSLEKKNPEFVKKLIGNPRDPVTTEFIENTQTELENIVKESSVKIKNLSSELNELLDEACKKFISKYEMEYEIHKNKIMEIIDMSNKVAGFECVDKNEYIKKLICLNVKSLKDNIEYTKKNIWKNC